MIKLAISILLFALCASAQNIMPPTNIVSFSVFERPEEVHLPQGDWTNIMWVWSAPNMPVSQIAGYNFFMSSTIHPWQGALVGSTTNLWYTIPITNTLMGFPGVQTVGTNGFRSLILI